jgi:predicted aspartyl protease
MPSHERAAIVLLSGTIALLNVACSRITAVSQPNDPPEPVAVSSTSSPVAKPSAKPKPAATPTSQSALAAKEAYERALDVAYSAATISQSAQSPGDWQLVSSRWQEAIALLGSLPPSSSYQAIAKQKISEYQRNLRIAQQLATRPLPDSPARTTVATAPRPVVEQATPPTSPITNTPTPKTNLIPASAKSQVITVPIKRRAGRTPVIEVMFNGGQRFEMIVDTGASGTVITQAMADSLGIEPEGEVIADTASAKAVKFPIGKVQSIAVEDAVETNVPVAIGGSELDLGLLGQDFYGKYDVWIKKDVVEFHPR